jgi:uncharacterized protein YbjQ (UPF0145 family)
MDAVLDFLDVILFAALFLLGFFAGRWNERRHYASIRKREKELAGVLVFSNRFPPQATVRVPTHLVSGSAVISDDYFKNVVAGLYSFFGGRVRTYESLVDRARRESVLRMKAAARAHGARMIVNVKFQTFAIGGRSQNSVKGVEVLAYGTAVGAPARA